MIVSMPTAPAPTAMQLVWFPAHATLPDGRVLAKTKIYATPEGLYIYDTIPGDGYTPAWHSPISDRAVKPATGWRARNGFTIRTDDGDVHITALGGCGCGWPLKRWSPEYARFLVAWE